MRIRYLFLCTFMYSMHAVVITTGAPKSGIQLLADCIKKLGSFKKITSCDMLLSHNDLVRNDLIVGTPVCNEQNTRLVQQHNAHVIYIIRDPRDQIASTAHIIYNYRSRIPAARNKTLNDIVSELITAGGNLYSYQYKYDEVKQVQGIADLYSFWLGWIDYPQVCVVHYETLIGAYGAPAQRYELQHIADFLNLPSPRKKIEKITKSLQSKGLFGFFAKKPTSGGWKKCFNQQHKATFKQVAGDLLTDLAYETSSTW